MKLTLRQEKEQARLAQQDLSRITHEPPLKRLPTEKRRLLVLWHERWVSFNRRGLAMMEVMRLFGALEQMGKVMLACSLLSQSAWSRLEYSLHSLTQFHLSYNRKEFPRFTQPSPIAFSAYPHYE